MSDISGEIESDSHVDFGIVNPKISNVSLLRKLDAFYARLISVLVFTVLMLTMAVCLAFGVLLYAADFERVIFFDGTSQVCLMEGEFVIPQSAE